MNRKYITVSFLYFYLAPKFFQVQKKSRKITVAKDPFSTDRELDVPKGGTFELKKGAKKVTKFIEFKKGDRTWKVRVFLLSLFS